ncbi:MAG: Rieske 2Fe-2S domain-containing protein [Rhizobiales bacterium]|nr:Rieske 2Fe-2S domain-containing protein [Hyphomicrobiales bacterium]
MNSLFDHDKYQGVRRPIDNAETLPPSCYTSEEFYKREVERIFLRVWNLVGREDYAPKPGDFFTLELVGTPVIIMRGHDGRLRAFVNSCRHRGAKLLDGEGNRNVIRCPYHSWIYDNLGNLRTPVGMQDAADFRREEMGLRPIRLETWLGFIFICFDEEAAPLSSYLGDLDQHVKSYGFESMVTVRRETFELPTNWKFYVENSMEHFHLPTVHEKTIGNVNAVWSWVIGNPGNYLILHSKAEKSRATLSGEVGFDRIPTLEGQAAQGAQYILIYPATVLGCDLDCMWFKQMIPDGPGRMRNVAAFCYPRPSVERPDFNEIIQRYNKRFDLVIAEDNFISVRQMQGLNHPLARAGRLSKREPLVHTIDNWILDRVLDPAAAAPVMRSA